MAATPFFPRMGETELRELVKSWAKPIYERVEGAPFQPGDRVQVVALADDTTDEEHLGKRGEVVHLEYSCGSGQHYPDDPMIGVKLSDSTTVEFWAEELAST